MLKTENLLLKTL